MNLERKGLVLLASDKVPLMRLVQRSLAQSDFHSVTSTTVEDLVDRELREDPIVVLVDDSFPGHEEAIQRLREVSDVPVILMVESNDDLAANGLRAGADQVLTKPFSSLLLIATLEACTRRNTLKSAGNTEATYRNGALVVDLVGRVVTLEGERLHLSVREFTLLRVLITNAGRVLTHDQLLRLVWGVGYEESGDLLRGYIRNLRRKIGDSARQPHFIMTENQVGYWIPRTT